MKFILCCQNLQPNLQPSKSTFKLQEDTKKNMVNNQPILSRFQLEFYFSEANPNFMVVVGFMPV